MTRSPEERVQDILEAIARCERYRERFDDSDDEVVEMRNILVHEYFGVDTDLIMQTLDQDLAPLASALRQHLAR